MVETLYRQEQQYAVLDGLTVAPVAATGELGGGDKGKGHGGWQTAAAAPQDHSLLLRSEVCKYADASLVECPADERGKPQCCACIPYWYLITPQKVLSHAMAQGTNEPIVQAHVP